MMKRILVQFCEVILIILMVFVATSAIFGGIRLILDPSGSLLRLPSELLDNSPFRNYLVPGILLILFLGFLPLLSAIGLIFRPEWKWAESLNIYENRHFSWSCSLYSAILLLTWITAELQLTGYRHFFQTLYSSVGILSMILLLLPAVMDYYRTPVKPKKGRWRKL